MNARGLALHALLVASLTAALGAVGFAFPQQPPAKELPQEEEKLWQYGQERLNRGAWTEADRAFKAFVERFPASKRGEEVHQQLAYIHMWQSRRYAEAREWFARACERYPKSQSYWQWRIQSAQSWSYQELRTRAVEEFRKISKEAPDAAVRTQAIQQAWNAEGKHLWMHVNQTFAAGQEPSVQVQMQKVDKIAFRATHVAWGALIPKLAGPDAANLRGAIDKVGPEGRRALKEWTAEFKYDKNEWKSEQVKLPSTEPGVYLLEGEHDGVVMSVTLFVSRLGLVTKTAAGKLLCFVQDRATSRPVEGAEIRVLGDKPIRGMTGADGVFVAEGFTNGTVVAIREGDLATTQSWWHDRGAERPLIHITTDRPIYRPNQEVSFRAVHRIEKGEKLELAVGRKVIIEVRDAKGNKVYEQAHAFDPFGAVEGSFVLGDEPALGEYTVFTRTPEDGADLHQHDWRWTGYWGPGPHAFLKFRVDEYRKPEYRVDVAFKAKSVLQGEEVSATIDARYFFGSPVVGADVQYTVHRRPQYNLWRCWAWYYDWYADENGDDDAEYRPRGRGRKGGGWYGVGEQVLQGSGKTDAEGKVAVVFSSQKWDHDAVYTVSAKVTDLSRRAVDGSGTCKATRAEFGLAMSLDKYVYKPGDRMNVRVRAATPDEKVVAGTEVVVKAHDRRWKDGKHDDAFLFEANAKTDAQGIAEFTLTSDRPGGYLWITAEAKDKRGNEVRAEHYAWLCGDSWFGDTVNLNGIDLLPDKKTYEPGETAQILVTSQFKNFSLLLTVEGKEIYHHEIVSVKGHTKTVAVKLDRAAYSPNVFISVTAIQSNQVVQKRKMLIVNPAGRFVDVEVKADKDQYRPRQKAVYEVVTKGADGKPVSAAVSLGIVDESIYALQEEYAEDIRKHFVYRRGDEVGTTTSLEYHDWGRADEKKEQGALRSGAAPGAPAPMAKAAAEADAVGGKQDGERRKNKDGGAEYAATEVRSKFADTMHWKTVVTGADGRARVEVDVPDNLTTWRITARAATADSRFGQARSDTLVRKEMIVRLEVPRFFTQGDATVVSAIVHNYLPGAKDVKVEVEAEGVALTGALSRIVRVDAEGQARIDWTAKVTSAGSARLTVKALADLDSDAMQLTVPIYAYGSVRYDSRAGVAEGRVVQKIVLPAGAAKEAAELVIAVNPTHASMVLDSLEYLAGYPYGCVEQTMSRFLPTVVVSKALQRLGIVKKELQEELPHMVQAGLQRLVNFQQQDGGWGWWQNDASNPWITAYVVGGLAMARDADHRVDPHVITRGVGALQRHLNEAKEADLQAYLLYALSVAGSRHDDVRARLTDRLAELRPYSKALLALVLKKDGRDAREVLAALAKEAQLVGASAQFEGGTRGHWLDHSMEVSAAALRAFLAVDPKHELVPKLVHWLSTVRQGNYWGSTKQTAMVVFAMTEYLAVSGDLDPDMTLSLTLNGKKIFGERITKANWAAFDGMRTFKGAQLLAGENEIVIEREGNGNPVWSIYAKYYAEGEVAPSEGGIRVERTYSKVINDRGQRVLQKLENGAALVSGDEVEVTVSVTADRDYEWLMLDCPMPSGFEAVREYWGRPGWGRWAYWYASKEFRDEKVSMAMTSLGQGTRSVSYVMRAEAPGAVRALPAAVFNMYHPQIGGNSGEFRFIVNEAK